MKEDGVASKTRLTPPVFVGRLWEAVAWLSDIPWQAMASCGMGLAALLARLHPGPLGSGLEAWNPATLEPW